MPRQPVLIIEAPVLFWKPRTASEALREDDVRRGVASSAVLLDLFPHPFVMPESQSPKSPALLKSPKPERPQAHTCPEPLARIVVEPWSNLTEALDAP